MANVTNELLDELKRTKSIKSDYALAKYLGVAQQTISNYRMGKSDMAPRVAIRVAEELQRDPADLLIRLAAARAADDREREVWLSRLGKAAGVLLAVVAGIAGAPAPTEAGQFNNSRFTAALSDGQQPPVLPIMRKLARALARIAQAARSALGQYLTTIPGRAALSGAL